MKVFCFFLNENQLLVSKTVDPKTFRLIGGNIEENENSLNAITREIKEELHENISEIYFLKSFQHLNSTKIDFYSAKFATEKLLLKETIQYIESDGKIYEAVWIDKKEFISNHFKLKPTGANEVLIEYFNESN